MKSVCACCLFLMVLGLPFSLGVVFYDQGTGVVNSSGSELIEGNLTIFVYDEASGGNLVYEELYESAINNGSWNVKIEADFEYGKSYFKDYEINGDDMDFGGDERVEFVSPYGVINDEVWVNFSLIGSCPVGSSIREVLENGSVVCEVDSSGNGTVDVDLSDYALRNESEVFAGNITTSEGGFFGWLGSLGSRISKIFVDDLDVDGSIVLNGTAIEDWDEVSGEGVWNEVGGVVSYVGDVNVSGGDLTAGHFFGNGSGLTGVVSEVDPNPDLNNVSLNDTLSFSKGDVRMYLKGGELFIEY